MKKILITILVLSSFNLVQSSTLDGNFRQNFTNFTNELCYSSINYQLPDKEVLKTPPALTFLKYRDKYNHTQNCLFNHAMSETVKNQNEYLISQVSDNKLKNILSKNLLLDYKDLVSDECKNDTLGNIFAKQEKKGFNSKCEESADDLSSSCRVIESALLEFCGFQFFATAKKYDDSISSRSEADDLGNFIKYDLEIENVKKTLNYMIDFYMYFRNIYLLNIFDEIDNLQWQKINNHLRKSADIFNILPNKFIDNQEKI